MADTKQQRNSVKEIETYLKYLNAFVKRMQNCLFSDACTYNTLYSKTGVITYLI
jgi:hypothetical protein